jgi:hypothetical protein
MCGRSSEHEQASHGRALGRDQRTGAQASFLQMAVHSSVAGSRVALVPIKQNGHPSPRGITRLPFPPLGRCRLSPPPPPSQAMLHHIHQSAPSQSGRSGQDDEEAELGDSMMGHESDDSPTPSASRPGQSGRKGSKKVRTGCITCK